VIYQKKLEDDQDINILVDDITVLKEFNRGQYGYVCEGEYKGNKVAIKFIHKLLKEEFENYVDDFKREALLTSSLNHPNLVKAYGWSDIKGGCLVMERLDMSLIDYFKTNKNIPIKDICKFACDIASGMLFLHLHSIIHRDMNLGNFLVGNNNEIKVGDLGLAKVVQNPLQKTRTPNNKGAIWFISPQVQVSRYTYKADIWSFGIIIFELCTSGNNNEETVSQVSLEELKVGESEGAIAEITRLHLTGECPITFYLRRKKLVLNTISEKFPVYIELKNLVQDCLQVREEDRPDFGDIIPQLLVLSNVTQLM